MPLCPRCCLKCEDEPPEAIWMCLTLPGRPVAPVALRVALSSVPGVEGTLSPDTAPCLAVVGLSVTPALSQLFIASSFCGFSKSGFYREILWFLVTGALDFLVQFRSSRLFSLPVKAAHIVLTYVSYSVRLMSLCFVQNYIEKYKYYIV